ncbi:MAG TPA: glycosyltransferase family 39 protein [Patescibacteria group bacterium]|nr:glycosyltransferase family 39 protein [Patescibacteria group bacterium]
MRKILTAKFLLIAIILLASILRLYRLSVNPPSLFGDELDLGYQAYSILHTGRDYMGNFMPVHFHSLAEWRTPLYLYSAVPTVAIFGITPLGVRLPAAIFGTLIVYAMYLLVNQLTKNKNLSLVSAFLLAVSPWLIQYSRAGFEVTEMLFLLILGLYLFIKSLDTSKRLWLSVALLVLMPWVYSTAKLFTPLLLIFLFVLYRKKILRMAKRELVFVLIAGLIIGVPIATSTVFGGGTQRINDISVFNDSKMEQTVGEGRKIDNNKFIYNKYTYWGSEILNNYFGSFSTDFLFLKGDANLRQSIGTGELYLIEIVPLLLGLAFFFFEKNINTKTKLLMSFWLLVGAFPSALTIGGGTHATRLILILPVLIFFISFGWLSIYKIISQKYKTFFIVVASSLYILSMVFYFHEYYLVYPINSEHWWHYGWGQAISEVKSIDSSYDRVIISMSGEPAWIFFAGHYEYNPTIWQKEFPIGNDIEVSGFGKISHTGKFYFGSPDPNVKIYGLGKYIDSKTLYLANASEDGENLILHPDKTPEGLKLIKSIPFPSGEPAFYLFSGIK